LVEKEETEWHGSGGRYKYTGTPRLVAFCAAYNILDLDIITGMPHVTVERDVLLMRGLAHVADANSLILPDEPINETPLTVAAQLAEQLGRHPQSVIHGAVVSYAAARLTSAQLENERRITIQQYS
jgi:hypothetical protein